MSTRRLTVYARTAEDAHRVTACGAHAWTLAEHGWHAIGDRWSSEPCPVCVSSVGTALHSALNMPAPRFLIWFDGVWYNVEQRNPAGNVPVQRYRERWKADAWIDGAEGRELTPGWDRAGDEFRLALTRLVHRDGTAFGHRSR